MEQNSSQPSGLVSNWYTFVHQLAKRIRVWFGVVHLRLSQKEDDGKLRQQMCCTMIASILLQPIHMASN